MPGGCGAVTGAIGDGQTSSAIGTNTKKAVPCQAGVRHAQASNAWFHIVCRRCVQVISMSLGWQETSSGSDVVHDLLTRLATQHPDDILWVAAAGNDGKAGTKSMLLDWSRQCISHPGRCRSGSLGHSPVFATIITHARNPSGASQLMAHSSLQHLNLTRWEHLPHMPLYIFSVYPTQATSCTPVAVVNDPAGYPEVVSVAAVDHDEMHADFSNTNSDVEW